MTATEPRNTIDAAVASLRKRLKSTIGDATRALTVECETVGEDLLVSARVKEW